LTWRIFFVGADGPLRLPGEGVLVAEAIWEISLCPCETRGLRGPVRDCTLLVFFFACWMKPAMASRLLEKKKKICQVAKAAGEKARPAPAIARTQSLTGGRLRRSIWLGMRNLSISMVQWHVGGSCLATGPRSGSAASAADCVLHNFGGNHDFVFTRQNRADTPVSRPSPSVNTDSGSRNTHDDDTKLVTT